MWPTDVAGFDMPPGRRIFLNMAILERHAELKSPDNIDSGGATADDGDVDENTRRIRNKRRQLTKQGRDKARARGVDGPTGRFDEWSSVVPPASERDSPFGDDLLNADD